jgi:hypothetical protein
MGHVQPDTLGLLTSNHADTLIRLTPNQARDDPASGLRQGQNLATAITQGTHHIGLTVSRLEDSAALFTRLLGWQECVATRGIRRSLSVTALSW